MDALTGLGRQTDARDGLMGRMFKIQKKSRVFKIEISKVSGSVLAAEICMARIIVCCGASIVAHFARKVRATNT